MLETLTPRARFLAACRCEPVDRPPVWLMRQAGRYLPEYHPVRGNDPFLVFCKAVDRAVEASLQPWRRFGTDAVIFFSDILVPLEAMGAEVAFGSQGPVVARPVDSRDVFCSLASFDPEEKTGFVAEIIRKLRAVIGRDTALIGFAGAPFTVACYATAGRADRTLATVKRLLYRDPELALELLALLAEVTADYLRLQVEAGCDAIQLFDSWAGELSPVEYARFAAPFQRLIFEKLPASIPKILFVKGALPHLGAMAGSGADVLSVDWCVDLRGARKRFPEMALQGNLDPMVLLGTEETIRKSTRAMLNAISGVGHIANLGHGVHQETPPENVGVFVAIVKEWRP